MIKGSYCSRVRNFYVVHSATQYSLALRTSEGAQCDEQSIDEKVYGETKGKEKDTLAIRTFRAVLVQLHGRRVTPNIGRKPKLITMIPSILLGMPYRITPTPRSQVWWRAIPYKLTTPTSIVVHVPFPRLDKSIPASSPLLCLSEFSLLSSLSCPGLLGRKLGQRATTSGRFRMVAFRNKRERERESGREEEAAGRTIRADGISILIEFAIPGCPFFSPNEQDACICMSGGYSREAG